LLASAAVTGVTAKVKILTITKVLSGFAKHKQDAWENPTILVDIPFVRFLKKT